MDRRDFIKKSAVASLAVPFLNFNKGKLRNKRLLILGFDGLDPEITLVLIKAGKLPNFKALANRGSFRGARTTIPPQSPVAWSSIATGADPGITGIYDFLHRDKENYFPKFSQCETTPASWIVKLGKYNLPLSAGETTLVRKGKPFWQYLEEKDIDSVIFKMPGNYPASSTEAKTISGMGTPSLRDGYGWYTLYTNDEKELSPQKIEKMSPNKVFYAYINDNFIMEEECYIEGPVNDLVKDSKPPKIPFKVYVDYKHKSIRVNIQGKEIILSEGEYSQWQELNFTLISGLSSIKGMVKFFLLNCSKEKFRLYISPLQVSPANPAIEICTPKGYSKELSDKVGLFHTLSLPSDTSALRKGTFNVDNFITQNTSIFNESRKILFYQLDEFIKSKEGLLFSYFSTLDQGQHLLWSLQDKAHPFHDKKYQSYEGAFYELYYKHDAVLGEVLRKLPKDVDIMVISDHGFAPFYRELNLNTWLAKEGYLSLDGERPQKDNNLYDYVDWSKTKAYSCGLNGLYINLKGRESKGIVRKEEKRKLLKELKYKLENLRDPVDGNRVINNAFISEDCYSRENLSDAPDIIMGFAYGYRSDDSSPIGELQNNFLNDRMDWWGGDHCVDPAVVPAAFFSSFKVKKEEISLLDFAPTILGYFGINKPLNLKGKRLI